MTEKFIDLKDTIHAETRDQVYLDEVGEVLDWLDEHPDQVPGRTITASRKREIARRLEFDPRYSFDEMVHDFGLVSVPDPEPTNADALVGDLLDCHVAFSERELDAIAGHLAERGWTKAPGGDDD